MATALTNTSATAWSEVPLGRFLAPRTKSVNPAATAEERFELYSVPSFDSGNPEIVRGGDIGSSKQAVAPGDVLLCKINPRINRVWIVGAMGEHQQIGSTEWIRFPKNEEIVPGYLAYYLQLEKVRSHLAQNASGIGGSLMRVKSSTIANEVLPLPHVAVQRRIAARIDELFSELDDAEEELRRARSELETYRKSLLKAAVTGELTADWRAANPPKETGAELLQRILADRRARWEADPRNSGKRYKEPSGAADNLLFDVPAGWTRAALGQLGDIVTGSTPSTSRADFYGGEVPFFTPGDLEGDEIRSTKRTLTSAGRDNVRAVPAGSVLVTCIGATIGKLAISGAPGATNQQINSVVPAETALSDWIYAFLSSPWGQQEILDRSSSTTLPILNKGDFSKLPIPLPPLQEIELIRSTLSIRIEESRGLLEAVGELADGPPTLRQSILAAAFRAELVR